MKRILAFKRIRYSNVLRIGRKQRIRNELYSRIHIKETLLQEVRRNKFWLFGHICRMDKNRKINNIMSEQNNLDEKNREGQPHREWLDDIGQWCQETSIYKLYRTAGVRDKWNAVVEKASSTYS